MSKNYAYIRVSTTRQHTENQRMLISDYCSKHGIALDEEIAVEMSSRKSMKSRGLDEMLSRLRKNDTLVVSEVSRLARNIGEFQQILSELHKKQVYLHIVRQGIKTNGEHDVYTKILLSVLSLVAELETDFLSSRIKDGLARAKREGKVLGNKRIAELNKNIVENADAWAESKRTLIESFIQRGMTTRQIVAELNALDIKTRTGKQWELMTLHNVMKRLGIKTRNAR